MLRRLFLLFLALFWLGVPVYSQEQKQKDRYVVVPNEIALTLVASKPECPLQFENVRYLARIGGGNEADFQLRNRGTKPVRSIGYAGWLSNGTGWTSAWPTRITREIVLPGQMVPLSNVDQDKIIPLTDELRDKLKLRGTLKVVVVLMVLRVEFSDGTIYNDESTFNELKKYFEKVGAAADP